MGGLVNHLLEDFFKAHSTTTNRTSVDMSPTEAASFRRNLKVVEHVNFLDKKAQFKKGKL